jgi:hypothetical protein
MHLSHTARAQPMSVPRMGALSLGMCGACVGSRSTHRVEGRLGNRVGEQSGRGRVADAGVDDGDGRVGRRRAGGDTQGPSWGSWLPSTRPYRLSRLTSRETRAGSAGRRHTGR